MTWLTKLREAAQRVGMKSWGYRHNPECQHQESVIGWRNAEMVAGRTICSSVYNGAIFADEMRHIARWDPQTALLVCDVLEAAERHTLAEYKSDDEQAASFAMARAFTVLRAHLGEREAGT